MREMTSQSLLGGSADDYERIEEDAGRLGRWQLCDRQIL